MASKNKKPYRLIGAFDTETTNINDSTGIYAFPILYQVGILNCRIDKVTTDNVREKCHMHLYRHAIDLYAHLDKLCKVKKYVPVLACHNLAFDMYALSPYLNDRECKVLAKSQRKPITITVLDDAGKPCLVFWDTLGFSQQSLERMGKDAGFEKDVGQWVYNLVRTPETPLTEQEIRYAKDDIYSLLVWLSWWLKRNPEISPSKLGLNVVTKTGVVRERRKVRFQGLKSGKYNVGKQWLYVNRAQAPKTDDELFTMQAATRGGFTFCASKTASIPFNFSDSNNIIAAFDAVSMHPAQMVTHRYPYDFHETSQKALDLYLQYVQGITPEKVLARWSKPFVKAIYACYEFENVRLKPDTVFSRHGIAPFASARFKAYESMQVDDDNGDSLKLADMRRNAGYADMADNARFEFGKLVSADRCIVYVTELGLWELTQAYAWDSAKAVHGYMTGRFMRPCDYATISIMQFFKAKNLFKAARGEYRKTHTISSAKELISAGVTPQIVHEMENNLATENDIDAVYQFLKSDLNACYGIETTNEYRRDTVLTSNGIEYTGEAGICNAPKNNKAWYQFGQRIVGWSRVLQICTMHLLDPLVDHIVCGDTDSLKVVCREDNLPAIAKALDIVSKSIDKAKKDNCARVEKAYPDYFDTLDGIGHYELEYTAKRFCAAWNKAYCEHDESGFSFTLAGIPSKDIYKDIGNEIKLYERRVNGLADKLHESGMSFEEVCNALLGYNVSYTHEVTGLNSRKFPQWGDTVYKTVTDYLGMTCKVAEPSALALYPMVKTIGSSAHIENRVNMRIALENNPDVNTENLIVSKKGLVQL